MLREEVYNRINEERTYQDNKWGALDKHPHEVAAWIVFMEHHLNKAKQLISTQNTDEDALHELRKVTTLGVACLEQHGCPDRQIN